MKRRIIIISAITVFFSLTILFYPTISRFLNQNRCDKSIMMYSESVNTLSENEKLEYLIEARKYNYCLSNKSVKREKILTTDYDDILNINKDGVIGFVEIPTIDVKLPIYHGTDENILAAGAAHIQNTSFPVGGADTHSVISAHTAYPGKTFFDDLDNVKKGDEFIIEVLNEELVYVVVDINIITPEETELLNIIEGKDCVSLVTCYPYAVNSHRLVITGERKDVESSTDIQLNNNEPQDNNCHIIVIIEIVIILIIVFLFFKCKRGIKNA